MSQHGNCFVPELAEQVSDYKRRVAQLRVPFAKQEVRGTGQPLGAEASVHNVDPATKDVSFKPKDDELWVRRLMNDFETLILSIRPEHVLKDIRESQLET